MDTFLASFPGASAISVESSTLSVGFSVFSGNRSDFGDEIMQDGGDIASAIIGTNSVSDDEPRYIDTTGSDPLQWDLTLAADSPLIDAGDPSLLDSDGSVSDIGAYGGPSAW